MTVPYRMSMADTWQYLCYLSTKTVTGRCLLVLTLATPFAAPLISLYQGAFLHHTAPPHHVTLAPRVDHLMVFVSLIAVAVTYIIIFSFGLLGLYLGSLITPKTTVTIDPDYCRLKTFLSTKSPWKQFVTIVEEPDSFYFLGWTRAFLVPKRAFNSSAEAHAFFDTTSAFWREAKGIVPPPAPDVSGVWPPAPRAGDFEELGGTPKG